MKAIMMTVRLWWFYLTYKGIKKAEIRKIFAKNFKGKIFECVSKTNWKKDLMKIPAEEREFFKQFVGKVGLCFECDKVEDIKWHKDTAIDLDYYKVVNVIENEEILKASCLQLKELEDYLQIKNAKNLPTTWGITFNLGKAIHITKLEIFDKPKEISEFGRVVLEPRFFNGGEYYEEDKNFLTRAPQSWCYVEI